MNDPPRPRLDPAPALTAAPTPLRPWRPRRETGARLLPTLAHTAPAAGEHTPSMLGTELHQLLRTGTTATIRTRGGHQHQQMRVAAVHPRHARLTDTGGYPLLVPRAFIEAVDRSAHRQARPTAR